MEGPLKRPMPDLFRCTSSELQHQQGTSLKGTSSLWGGSEISGIRARAGEQLSPRQKVGRNEGYTNGNEQVTGNQQYSG